jgi:hypothetical protein
MERKAMTEFEVPMLEIAREYLDAAIEFFLERTKFFCAIHLAGAAGELFDAHLQKSEQFFTSAWKAEKTLKSETGQVPTDEATDKAADKAARQSVNKWKNEVKHMNDGSQTVTIDPEFAAECLIEKALVSFYKLKLRKSPAIWKFEDHQNRKSQGDKDERRPRAQGRDL